MKRLLLLCLAFAMLIALCGCGGDVSDAELVIGESQLYSNAQIKSAMREVLDHFDKHFDGCILVQLQYDEAYSLKYAQQEAQQHDAKEAIILTSIFDVDETGGDGSLNPNSRYEGFQWILTRGTLGTWKLRDWGYA